MRINGRLIAAGMKPYIVAEIGASHGGRLAAAISLIWEAKDNGADAVKFQAYTPDTITIDCDKDDFILKSGPWAGRKLHELYRKAHTPREWFPSLISEAERCGISWFSSVFSEDDVDFLEKLGCPAYKIASMEIVDTGLIAYAAKTNNPIIISTGMASMDDIDRALEAADRAGAHAENVLLMHCVSGYPTPVEEASLADIMALGDTALGKMIHGNVGLSDHSKSLEVPIAATALGVCMIEKHIKHLDDNTSEDADFALTPGEFCDMCDAVNRTYLAMQPSQSRSEGASKQLRRSLYAVRDIKCGEAFTRENVRSIRPGYGMSPVFLPALLRHTAACDIERGSALLSEMVRWS